MTQEENNWIERCRSNIDKYVITVDNDCAFVIDLDSYDCVFEFTHWGWMLALDLLLWIGCNAEEA